MIKYFRLLLLPFSVIYGIVVVLRNKLFDIGIFKQTVFDLPVICIGNLVVGGSGKSPVTEYLVNLLKDRRIAILSRGYGRKTKGFIIADKTATAQTIGDEPMQFYSKFAGVTVAVCEDRLEGINRLKASHDLIILDDAYQHRSVKPGFSILLFEFDKLITTQFLLPAGNLREPFNGYKRADLLLVTKTPANLTPHQKSSCQKKFSSAQLRFSFLAYQQLIHFASGQTRPCSSISGPVYLLTGIANPKPLLQHLEQYASKIHHHDYPDHYQFNQKEILKLVDAFNKDPDDNKIIITTEKDVQRLLDDTLKKILINLPVFYLPIKIAVLEEDKTTFDQKILTYVSNTTRNR